MAAIDYTSIYAIQDRMLAVIFSGETSFYLTGGTCLHRFYYERRYSADLDLFTSDNALFRDDIRLVKTVLDAKSIRFETQVDTRDFVRLFVEKKLQVDLVNDRVYRHGKPLQSPQRILLDNMENIAANKICAVLGRDDPKDVFDLYTVFQAARIDWSEVFSAADKKCVLDAEVLEYRLSAFPLDLLDLLHVKNQDFLAEMKRHYPQMRAELLQFF
jgi:predicted nucleotidyltransferase component of viral defense system